MQMDSYQQISSRGDRCGSKAAPFIGLKCERIFPVCVFIAELSQLGRSNDRPKFVLLLLDPPIIKLYNLIITLKPEAALDTGS